MDCSLQVAIGYRNDAPSAPLHVSAWLNASDGGAWRFDALPNGWLLFVTLLGDAPADGTTLALTSDGAVIPDAVALAPDAADCAPLLEAPVVTASAAIVAPGAQMAPLLVSLGNGIAGSTIYFALNGAGVAQYTAPFIVASCATTALSASAVKSGYVPSNATTAALAQATAAAPPGSLPVTCAAISKRSSNTPSTGSSAALALGVVGGGRDANCNVLLTVQYGPTVAPASGAGVFAIVRSSDGANATFVAAAGFDTTLNLGNLAGSPTFTLYAQAIDGSWSLANATLPSVTAGLTCQAQAAAPSIVPAALLVSAPSNPAYVVTISSGYPESANATTYITTDGSDPTVSGGSRIWFSGATAWNMTLQVSESC